MLVTIKCPSCGVDTTMSLVDPDLQGPFRCWKCHAVAAMVIKGGQVESLRPLTPEETKKLEEAEEAKAKMRRGGGGGASQSASPSPAPSPPKGPGSPPPITRFPFR